MRRHIPIAEQDAEVLRALHHLVSKLEAYDTFRAEVETFNVERPSVPDRKKQPEKSAENWLRIARLGLQAGAISESIYFHIVTYAIEAVLDERILKGTYEAELREVEEEIRGIEAAHGLAADEFWLIDDGPPAWQAANREYDRIRDALLVDVFRQYGEFTIADIRENRPEEYYQRAEEGRTIIFEGDFLEVDILRGLIKVYKAESEACARAGAYYAACATLGAAFEAILLIWCYQHLKEVAKIIEQFPAGQRRPRGTPDRWSLDQLETIASIAGWIPTFEIDGGYLDATGLIHLIRDIRNLLHPGRHLREKPKVRIGERDFEDAMAVYLLIESQFNSILGDVTEEISQPPSVENT